MSHFLLILVLAAFTGCDATEPVSRDPVPFRVLLQSGDFFEEGEGVPPASIALRSEAEEQAFLADYPRTPFWTSDGGPFLPPFPEVDYSTETAVVLALGPKPVGNISVRLDSIVVEGNSAVVYATAVNPCMQQRSMANPAVVVAAEGAGREITFAPLGEEDERCR